MLLDRRSAPFLAVGVALVHLAVFAPRVIVVGGTSAPRGGPSRPGRGDLRGQRTVEDDSNTNVRPSPSRTRVPGSRRRLRRGGSGVHGPSSGPDT